MKKVKWIGLLVMCATMVYGQQNIYYKAVVSGNGLLDIEDAFKYHVDHISRKKLVEKSEKNFKISIRLSEEKSTPDQQQFNFKIGGMPLSVVMTNGIIVAMSRDGVDSGLTPPRLKLRGNADWVDLSTCYYAEALKLLPFTHFIGVSEPVETHDISVIGRNVAGRTFRFICGASGRARLIHYSRNGIRHIHEMKNENRDLLMRYFDDISITTEGWSWVFTARFDDENGSLIEFSRKGLTAMFFQNGGLKSLDISDQEKYEGLFEKGWNEKGELIHERDLKKDPYPDFDLEDVIMLKGGREI